MTEFIDAFKLGIRAATEIVSQQLDIDEVFAELEDAVSVATDNRVTLRRGSSFLAQTSAAIADINRQGSSLSRAQVGPVEGGLYLSLVGSNDKRERIADWVQHPKVFLYSLKFEKREITARNKVELKRALVELLESPLVGIAFLSLIKHSSSLLTAHSVKGGCDDAIMRAAIAPLNSSRSLLTALSKPIVKLSVRTVVKKLRAGRCSAPTLPYQSRRLTKNPVDFRLAAAATELQY